MRKIIVTTVFFTLLLACSVFAVTMEKFGNYYEVQEFTIEKGWNLVYWFDPWYLTGEVEASDIKAMYALDPFDSEYVQYYPENKLFGENGKYNEAEWIERWPYFANAALWLYSTEVGSSSYKRYDVIDLSDTKLKSGWNFLAIIPDMISTQENPIKIKDFQGTCIFERVCGWDPQEKNWFCDLLDEELQTNAQGRALAIKVSEDCALETSSIELEIPPLP